MEPIIIIFPWIREGCLVYLLAIDSRPPKGGVATPPLGFFKFNFFPERKSKKWVHVIISTPFALLFTKMNRNFLDAAWVGVVLKSSGVVGSRWNPMKFKSTIL